MFKEGGQDLLGSTMQFAIGKWDNRMQLVDTETKKAGYNVERFLHFLQPKKFPTRNARKEFKVKSKEAPWNHGLNDKYRFFSHIFISIVCNYF